MPKKIKTQQGSVLLEALIAVIIFSIGILGLVAMLARSTAEVTDTRLRDDIFVAFFSEIAEKQVISRDPKNNDDPNLSIEVDTLKAYLPNEEAFVYQSKKSLQTSGGCSGSVTISDRDEGAARGYVSTNSLSYGVSRDGETNETRKVKFCAYRDDGPRRQ